MSQITFRMTVKDVSLFIDPKDFLLCMENIEKLRSIIR